jgi:hypothetical protein
MVGLASALLLWHVRRVTVAARVEVVVVAERVELEVPTPSSHQLGSCVASSSGER